MKTVNAAAAILAAGLLGGCFYSPPAADPAAQANAAAVEAVLTAIDQNLGNLGGSFTADYQCQTSYQPESTVDGKVYASGATNLRLHGGSAGYIYVHDNREYNWTAIQRPDTTTGRRWHEPGWPSAGITPGLYTIGMIDLRAILAGARDLQASLVVGPNPIDVAGTSCTVVSGGGLTLWVQADNPKRLLAVEFVTDGGVTKFRTVFSGWASRNAAGSELPTQWHTIGFHENVQQREWLYTLSNVQAGVAVPAALFVTVGMGEMPQ